MKKLVLSLAVIFAALSSYAQTADEVVEKSINATGGKENWKKINSAVMTGVVKVNGMDVNVNVTNLHMKGSRQDISVAGMTGFMIATPTKGYMYMPFNGQTKPEPMTPEDVKESLDDLDLQGNLIDYKAKGHSIELLGTEEIEGTECFKLKVTRKTSGPQTIFIDKASYLPIRIVTKRKAMGQEMDVMTDMSDYREQSGVKVPYSISQQFGTVVFSSIKLNEPVDEKVFELPAK